MSKSAETELEHITGSELARRLNVTETAVRNAVKSGRLIPAYVDTKGRRYFTEDDARSQWNRNTLPEKGTGRSRVDVGDDSGQSAPKLDATRARVMRETAQARILNFKANELENKLVNAEAAAQSWERHIGDARRMLLALPADLRLHIPALTNEDQRLIEERIASIMNSLVNWNPKESPNE